MSLSIYGCTYGSIVLSGLLGRTLAVGGVLNGFEVFVGGKDYTGMLDLTSVHVEDTLGERNTADFQLISTDLSKAPRFSVGEVVQIKRNGALEFGGMVERVRENVPGESGAMFVRVRCTDFNALADRHVVSVKLAAPGQTLRDVVSILLNSYSGDDGERLSWTDLVNKTGGDGVEIDGDSVQVGPKMGTLVFNRQTIRQAYDELAQLTGYWWNIDYKKILHFVDRTAFRAPLALDPNSWQGYTDLEVSRERGDYRNIQFLGAGKDVTTPESQVDRFKGNGENQSFSLRLEVSVPLVANVAKPPKVEVDTGSGFVEKTVGVRQKDKNKDWYYAVGDKEITQDSAGTALGATHILRVTYTGAFPIVVKARNDAEIAARRVIEQGSGATVDVESDEKLNDAELAEEKVASLLRRYGRIPNTVRYSCFTPGFQAGQLLSVNLPDHGIAGDYLIDQVTLRWHGYDPDGHELYAYEVSAVEGEFLGGWADFFRRQASRGRPFTVRENESLTLLVQSRDPVSVGDQILTSAPLGSVLDDVYSYLAVDGPWVGGYRETSTDDPTPHEYFGAAVGFPPFAGVS